jgi:di/tricarboxylate transporter
VEPQGWLALGIACLAFVLFAWNRFRPDVAAFFIATLLVLTGLVTPAEGVSGFANEATITVALLLVLSTGLAQTGAVDVLVRTAVRMAGRSELRLLLLVVGIVIPLSAVINNTAVVAVLVPAIIGASRQVEVSPSRILMPLSFASQLGGTLTLIGTSTNLLVAGLVLDLGFERIRIFDLTLPALVVVAAGVLFLVTVGRWLMPEREATRDLLASYDLHDYLTTVRVRAGSRLAGKSIGESRIGEEQGLMIIRIDRAGESRVHGPGASAVLREGDLLLVEGKVKNITEITEAAGLEIQGADPRLPDAAALPRESGEKDAVRFAEVLVPPRSNAIGRTLRMLRLRTRYAVSVLALRRHGEPVHENLGEISLRPGDVLLAQGRSSALRQLHDNGQLTLIGPVDLSPTRRRKRRWAIVAISLTVLLAAFELLPIMVAAMVGTALLLLTRTLGPDEAYKGMDWMVVILLATIIPLGIALEKSGAAAQLAAWISTIAGPFGPYGLLAAVYIITSLLTNAISNVAAAALVFPIAAALATSSGLSPTPFALAVMFAASNAFMTPIGYQTNLFIYGPGGYRFSDFLRVGAPLSVVTAIAAIIAIPLFVPLIPQPRSAADAPGSWSTSVVAVRPAVARCVHPAQQVGTVLVLLDDSRQHGSQPVRAAERGAVGERVTGTARASTAPRLEVEYPPPAAARLTRDGWRHPPEPVHHGHAAPDDDQAQHAGQRVEAGAVAFVDEVFGRARARHVCEEGKLVVEHGDHARHQDRHDGARDNHRAGRLAEDQLPRIGIEDLAHAVAGSRWR